jgi:hypothetical protein
MLRAPLLRRQPPRKWRSGRDSPAVHTLLQVFLPAEVSAQDAEALCSAAGCSRDEAERFLDALSVSGGVGGPHDQLHRPDPRDLCSPAATPRPRHYVRSAAPRSSSSAAQIVAAAAAALSSPPGGEAADGAEGEDRPSASGRPSNAQLMRAAGQLVGLLQEQPALRSAAMQRGAPAALLAVGQRHIEKGCAANCVLALAALAAGAPGIKVGALASVGAGSLSGALRSWQSQDASWSWGLSCPRALARRRRGSRARRAGLHAGRLRTPVSLGLALARTRRRRRS